MEYSNVLSPYNIAGLNIKNRFVVPALATNFGNSEGRITEQLTNYYLAKAKGGFGLIIIEIVAVEPGGRALPNQLGLWDDSFIPEYKALIKLLHQYGAKVAIQLHHAGRQSISKNIDGKQIVAPSAIPCPVRKEMPRELTTQESYDLTQSFADAAYRAFLAGADAVEINGAHGYLINQFMSRYSNKRFDDFGGTFERRMKFPLEIIKRINRKMASGFPLLFRISADENVPGGRDLLETITVAKLLEESGIDAISISAGVYASLDQMSAPGSANPGHLVHLASEVKQHVSIPVITAGKINYPQLAEAIISTGKADFVALGRVSIADPEFPNKVSGGAVNEIAPCVSCLQGCLDHVLNPAINKISCLVNPFVGKEGEWIITESNKPKKIFVAGAGPAGLEFSWIAAKRGHNVTCYESNEYVGGQLKLAGIPSTKDAYLRAIVYYHTMCNKYGVQFKMGTPLTKAIIESEKPDVVILATGGVPIIPNISNSQQCPIVLASDILEGKAEVGNNALVVGGGSVGAETAGYIAERGSQATIIELQSEIAADEQSFERKFLLERLNDYGVKFVTNAKVSEFKSDGVAYETLHSKDGIYTASKKQLSGFDTIVIAIGSTPNNVLQNELIGSSVETITIGDALKIGTAMNAVFNAAEIAINI